MDQRQPTMVARPGTFSIPLAATTVQHHYQQSPPQPQPQQVQQPRPAPAPPTPSNRTYYPQELADPQKLEQSYSRSVTIVYWHKSGSEPIRIRKEIPTFPWFQLSQCTDIVAEVGLSHNTSVDAYNPAVGTWEQQNIHTVRRVSNEQRLLYRSRKSLLEGMTDRDCLTLDHEIKLQGSGMQQPLRKRSLPDAGPSEGSNHPNKQLKVSHASFPSDPGPSHLFPQSLPSTSHGHAVSSSSPTLPQASPEMLPRSPFISQEQALPQSPEAPVENFSSHPPLKRWPNDYAVCEIAAGLSKMDELVNQTPSLTQKAAFERVFGCRYVKSTVCRHRGVWRKADKSLREAFERMGQSEQALWGEFVKRTDFRRDRGSKSQQVHDQSAHDHQAEEQSQHAQHHQLEYGMSAAAMGSLGLGLVDPGVTMGVNGGMDEGLNGNQSPLGTLGPQ